MFPVFSSVSNRKRCYFRSRSKRRRILDEACVKRQTWMLTGRLWQCMYVDAFFFWMCFLLKKTLLRKIWACLGNVFGKCFFSEFIVSTGSSQGFCGEFLPQKDQRMLLMVDVCGCNMQYDATFSNMMQYDKQYDAICCNMWCISWQWNASWNFWLGSLLVKDSGPQVSWNNRWMLKNYDEFCIHRLQISMNCFLFQYFKMCLT